MMLILFGVVTVLLRSVSSMTEVHITCETDNIYENGDFLAFINYKCSGNVHAINFANEHPTYFGCSNWDMSGMATKVYQINFENCQMTNIEHNYFEKYPNLVEFYVSFTGF